MLYGMNKNKIECFADTFSIEIVQDIIKFKRGVIQYSRYI